MDLVLLPARSVPAAQLVDEGVVLRTVEDALDCLGNADESAPDR